ncbi:flagellar biosynthetic protein FliO [Bacillota bacterium LX-D]|nr:flagellar biosynthetic protein FliO [Bacillota bacterium LX-D]
MDLFAAILRIVIFLPIVAALAYIYVKYGLGKMSQYKTSENLQVVDRVTLGPKANLFVVKVVDQYYLMSISEQQIQLLKELKNYPQTEDYIVKDLNVLTIHEESKESWSAKLKMKGKK